MHRGRRVKGFILAAGFGERLRPVTDLFPKPLVPVANLPSICYALSLLAGAGITSVIVNLHYRPDAIREYFRENRDFGLDVTFSYEPEILGTGGGVANAAPLLGDGDVVVWNGDILAPLDVTSLLEAHAKRPVGATLAIAPRPRGEGTVGVGAGGDIVRLRGERFGEEVSGGDFLGVSVVSAGLRRTRSNQNAGGVGHQHPGLRAALAFRPAGARVGHGLERRYPGSLR